jgi:curved DNA-binding protein
MAVEFKDYYKILGVPRKAKDEEIRKAFRKLAREYHPDVAKDKASAEEKFKELNEAYEVLGDPDKRKKYDELGADWKHGSQFRPPPGWEGGQRWRRAEGADGFQGFEFTGTGFSDFFEQFFGGSFGRRGGPGGFSGVGGGAAQRGQDVEADLMVTLEEAVRGATRRISLRMQANCPTCGGLGVVGQGVCPTCHGRRTVPSTREYTVRIPAGVSEGQRLRLAGKGESGAGRGPAGDLYLRVRLAKHPDYRLENGRLYFDLDLAPWEAVLGTEASVRTLDGAVNIRIPPGTKSGTKLRLRSKGLPAGGGDRGDLLVVTRIQVPEKVSDVERKLWEHLARESDFRPRE